MNQKDIFVLKNSVFDIKIKVVFFCCMRFIKNFLVNDNFCIKSIGLCNVSHNIYATAQIFYHLENEFEITTRDI